MNKKEIIINCVLIYISLSVFIFGLEIGLNSGIISSSSERDYKFCNQPNNPKTQHPEYGWTEHPNHKYLVSYSNKEGESWYWHTYNSRGFRDTYNSGNRSIIVLGDSFTMGVLSDDNSTYPHLLDRWTPNTSFRNYGMSGYGTAQELVVYENISDNYQHSTVIVGYYMGNDMKNNVNDDRRRPKFEIENNKLVQVRKPDYSSLSALKRTVWDFLTTNTNSYSFIRKKASLAPRTFQGPPEPPTGEELTRQKEITRYLISDMSNKAEAHNATILIVGIPIRGDVNSKNPALFQPEDAELYGNTQRQLLNNISNSRENIHYIDMEQKLIQKVEKGERVYGVDNGHLNEYGYRITAKAIYNWLKRNDKIEHNNPVDFTKDYDVERSTCP